MNNEMLTRTLAIIPAYNEGRNIFQIVRGICERLPGLDIVVVNDGSADDTAVNAAKAGAVVISHVCNMGYGIALQTAYKYAYQQAKYDYFVQMDGDGQHNVNDIPALLETLIRGEVDLVIGSRFVGENKSYKIPFARRVGMAFFRGMMYLFTHRKIKDITSGLQAFSRKVLNHYISDEFPSYYPDANVLIMLIKNGYKISEIPAVMFENKEGKSMHKGIGQQMYYVITMVLSIFVVVIKTVGKKHAT